MINTGKKTNDKEKNSTSSKEEEPDTEKKETNRNNEKEESDEEDSISTKSSNDEDDDSEILRKAWDEITLVTEDIDCIRATEYERKVTINTLSSSNIQLDELVTWKNRNPTKIPDLIQRSNGREYKALKKIVNLILDERERERLKENRFSILGEEDEDDESSEEESEGTSHPRTEESLPQDEKDGKGRGA